MKSHAKGQREENFTITTEKLKFSIQTMLVMTICSKKVTNDGSVTHSAKPTFGGRISTEWNKHIHNESHVVLTLLRKQNTVINPPT
jgi:hypothetical protein